MTFVTKVACLSSVSVSQRTFFIYSCRYSAWNLKLIMWFLLELIKIIAGRAVKHEFGGGAAECTSERERERERERESPKHCRS